MFKLVVFFCKWKIKKFIAESIKYKKFIGKFNRNCRCSSQPWFLILELVTVLRKLALSENTLFQSSPVETAALKIAEKEKSCSDLNAAKAAKMKISILKIAHGTSI